MGSRKGKPNKNLYQWQRIEAAEERKLEMAKTKTQEAIEAVKEAHGGVLTIDSLLKTNLETIQLAVIRLNLKAKSGLVIDRDDAQTIKDFNSILLTMKSIEKELIESMTDEELLKIAESREGESAVKLEDINDIK